MMNNYTICVRVSPAVKRLPGPCFLHMSSVVKYCTAVPQCNTIRSRRDLEVGQNHIYQRLNLSLHSRGRLSRMRQVFKSVSAF